MTKRRRIPDGIHQALLEHSMREHQPIWKKLASIQQRMRDVSEEEVAEALDERKDTVRAFMQARARAISEQCRQDERKEALRLFMQANPGFAEPVCQMAREGK